MKGSIKKRRQWLWFAGLSAGGMIAMLLLAGLVRLLLRISGSAG